MYAKRIDPEITLVRYYPNFAAALPWYQDPGLCKQVSNRDVIYDQALLKETYRQLNKSGDLFYIKYRNRLCGDVCLQTNGQVTIMVPTPYQNRHIGRRVMREIIRMAREKEIPELRATIYPFNTQAQQMFRSVGFRQTGEELYTLTL